MSYANQFRVKMTKGIFGQTHYEQGCFWSEKPFSRMGRAIVHSRAAPVSDYVAEVHQSTPTQKGMSDFSFNGVRVQ